MTPDPSKLSDAALSEARFRRPYFRIVEMVAKGLMRAETRYGVQLWSSGKQRARGKHCWLTDAAILPGETTWRPVTNGENRGHRITKRTLLQAQRAGKGGG